MHYPIDEQTFLAEVRRQGIADAAAEEVLPVINQYYAHGLAGRSDPEPQTGNRFFDRWCEHAYHAGVLERMRRYIDRTGFKNEYYSMILSEVYALGELGAVEAAGLAFDYGRAKGWRAARKAAKPRQAVGSAGL